MQHYNIGDQVWHATYTSKPTQRPCPVCYGQKEVRLILGNGDEVLIPCDYCGHGMNDPTGYITEYEYTPNAEPFLIGSVTLSKDSVEYRSGCNVLYPQDIFGTKEEALARAAAKGEQQRLDDETQAHRIKHNHYKTYAWNAGYHMRQVTDAKRRIAYHEKMARICKERSKTPEEVKV